MESDKIPKQEKKRETILSPDCYFLTVAKHGVDVYCVAKPQSAISASVEAKVTDTAKELDVNKIKSWQGAQVAEWSLDGKLVSLVCRDAVGTILRVSAV